jgi:hypothetical protein
MTSHQTVTLGRGRHSDPSKGACVMELASMLAGERFSDHPRSVCPVIARYLRALNDGLDDERRQGLYGLAANVVGTAGSRRERARRRTLCRKRNLELRRDSSRADRFFAALLRDEAAEACAAAFLEAELYDEAIAFASELCGPDAHAELLGAAPAARVARDRAG